MKRFSIPTSVVATTCLSVIPALHADVLLGISISAPADSRIVEGSTTGPLSFGMTNLDGGADSTFDIDLTPGSTGSLNSLTQPDAGAPGGERVDTAPGTPWVGASLLAGNSGVLKATPNLASAVAGDVVNFGVVANNPGWAAPVGASTSINVVQNRLLTGSAVINAGRHVGLAPIGTVTLNGGDWTDSEATRIQINSGTLTPNNYGSFARMSNGLWLTSATDFTFNGAGQTHDLQIGYNGPNLGNYSINATLPGAGSSTYTDASGNQRQDFGGYWQTSAEYGNILGQTTNLSAPDSIAWWNFNIGGLTMTNTLAETPQPAFPATRSGSVTNWELARGAGPLVNERVDPLIQGEVINGSSLDLSGVSIQVTGTALANRQIGGGAIDLGRQMVGTTPVAINRSDVVNLTTSGSDDTRTRLSLGAFSIDGGSFTAEHAAPAVFTDGSHTSQVALTGNFVKDSSVQGLQTAGINVASYLTGEGLAGETVQSNLLVGYTWRNVMNNKLVADDLLVIDYANKGGSRTYYTNVDTEYYGDDYTYIGSSGGSVQVVGTKSQGMHNLGTKNVTAIAEGLVGEDISQAGTSFTTHYASIGQAAYTVADNGPVGGPLTDGDKITITDIGSGIYQAHTQIGFMEITGGDKLDYEVSLTGSPIIQHGQNTQITVNYTGDASTPTAGQMTRISKGNLAVSLYDAIDFGSISSAWGKSGDVDWYAGDHFLQQFNYELETRFEAPAAATASTTVASGSDFGVNGLALQNTEANTAGRFSVATSMELLDSETIGGSTQVQVSFVGLDDADAAVVNALEQDGTNVASLAGFYGGADRAEFTSDIIEVTGLDGIHHVLQIAYQESSVMLDEASTQILWQTTYDDNGDTKIAWVNAVLGNSNITDLNLLAGTLMVDGQAKLIADYLGETRFVGSYEEYLTTNNLTDPELGAWGFDADANVVWASIDHNSSFAAAVPEPGSIVLLAINVIAGLCIRRRR